MQALITANIIGTVINIALILFLYYELKRLRIDFNEEKTSHQEFKTRMNELTELVKYLTKLNIDKFKSNKEKAKVVPFKPEDADKIKGVLDVSN
jgi:Ser-tRNA(Ala) deacylase AlaX